MKSDDRESSVGTGGLTTSKSNLVVIPTMPATDYPFLFSEYINTAEEIIVGENICVGNIFLGNMHGGNGLEEKSFVGKHVLWEFVRGKMSSTRQKERRLKRDEVGREYDSIEVSVPRQNCSKSKACRRCPRCTDRLIENTPASYGVENILANNQTLI